MFFEPKTNSAKIEIFDIDTSFKVANYSIGALFLKAEGSASVSLKKASIKHEMQFDTQVAFDRNVPHFKSILTKVDLDCDNAEVQLSGNWLTKVADFLSNVFKTTVCKDVESTLNLALGKGVPGVLNLGMSVINS